MRNFIFSIFILLVFCGGAWAASYSTEVTTDPAATYWWRANEVSGTTAAESIAGTNAGTYQNAPTLNQSGPSRTGDNAPQWNPGSTNNQFIETASAITLPSGAYSLEVWFNTSDTGSSAMILMQANADQNGDAVNNRDHALYMGSDKKLYFEDFSTTTTAINSSNTYNDGGWHHTVAVWDGTNMRLYVDSILVAGPTAGAARSYTGYWILAGGSSGSSWPAATAATFLPWKGKAGEFAVYGAALTAKQVMNHFYGSGYQVTVNGDSPAYYWRTNENNSSNATVADFADANNGTYQAGPTLNQPGPARTGDGIPKFNGSTQYIQTATAISMPNTFSLECWFNTSVTASSNPMVLIEGNASQDGTNATHDRAIYMGNDQKIYFDVFNNTSAVVIGGGSTYNDGLFHQVVATSDGTNLNLYVDTTKIGGPTAPGGYQSYTGYWVIGDGFTGSTWTAGGTGSTSYPWNGYAGECSVYSAALTSAQITSHYAVAAAVLNNTPVIMP